MLGWVMATSDRKAISHRFFVMFLLLLPISAALLTLLAAPAHAALIAFDLSAAAFGAAVVRIMGPATPDQLRRLAARNDAGRVVLLAITAILLVVVLVVVGVELEGRGRPSGFEVFLVVSSLTSAWLFGSLVFAIHYTHMFYDPGVEGDHGSLLFPGTDTPRFADFCYFAFGLGMTFQVSDVQIASRRIRLVATAHSLVAFFFNMGVLGLTVNLIASSVSLR
jgi:uncharacterized membrane protein